MSRARGAWHFEVRVRERVVLSLLAFVILVAGCGGDATAPPGPWPGNLSARFNSRPMRGVFAYSRISPNGRFLAYASESRSIVSGTGRSQEIVVVDLVDGAEIFRRGMRAVAMLWDELARGNG